MRHAPIFHPSHFAVLAAVAVLASISTSAATPLGIGAPFCYGDGTSGNCPCINNGTLNHGCENSVGTGGGVLSAVGTADLCNNTDSVVFTGTFLRPNSLCIFFQGDSLLGSPAFFGDGLRCMASPGGFIRFGAKISSPSGDVTYPETGDCMVHDAVQPPCHPGTGDPLIGCNQTRYYQLFYRDPDPGFCPPPSGSTFNGTNAIPITW